MMIQYRLGHLTFDRCIVNVGRTQLIRLKIYLRKKENKFMSLQNGDVE